MTVKKDTEAMDKRLEEAALLLEAMAPRAPLVLEAMAKELRGLKKGSQKKNRSKEKQWEEEQDDDEQDEDFELQVGDRVKVIRARDPYTNRTGVIIDRHGTEFWNLRLDADKSMSYNECVIYKKDSSLCFLARVV